MGQLELVAALLRNFFGVIQHTPLETFFHVLVIEDLAKKLGNDQHRFGQSEPADRNTAEWRPNSRKERALLR